MPIYLRRFYLKKLIDVKKDEESQMKKALKNFSEQSEIYFSKIIRIEN